MYTIRVQCCFIYTYSPNSVSCIHSIMHGPFLYAKPLHVYSYFFYVCRPVCHMDLSYVLCSSSLQELTHRAHSTYIQKIDPLYIKICSVILLFSDITSEEATCIIMEQLISHRLASLESCTYKAYFLHSCRCSSIWLNSLQFDDRSANGVDATVDCKLQW